MLSSKNYERKNYFFSDQENATMGIFDDGNVFVEHLSRPGLHRGHRVLRVYAAGKGDPQTPLSQRRGRRTHELQAQADKLILAKHIWQFFLSKKTARLRFI